MDLGNYIELKTWPAPFHAAWVGMKTHEFRIEDRVRFEPGELVALMEYDPNAAVFTGRRLGVVVTYVSRGPEWGIPVGYVAFSFKVTWKGKA